MADKPVDACREKNRTPPGPLSQNITENSNALDLEDKVFTRSPREIARSLKRSAERSTRRKVGPFRSAMSMLTFYANRAGKTLSAVLASLAESA